MAANAQRFPNLIFFFDGIERDINDFEGTKSSSFTFRKKDEGGGSAKSYSPDLTLSGDTYQYVRNKIINAVSPALVSIDVLIYDNCCKDEQGS